MAVLAINGGQPVRKREWPKWPISRKETRNQLNSVLRSGRWSLKEEWTGIQSKNEEFSKEFSEFLRVPFSVPTASGSSGLMIALEALDIGVGDEVIVPVLTWISTALSVINVNATPVLVDVDPETACISCKEAEDAITEKTKAILPVHYLCSMADMDNLMQIANNNDLKVVEDCAQACGSSWDGKYAGTIGDIGVFSTNQEKVLACGEGGVVVTKDNFLYKQLIKLRTDGCMFSPEPPAIGESELIENGGLQGGNYCMSEFQAAVLIDQLDQLGRQNDLREKNAKHLDHQLATIKGLDPLNHPPQMNKTSYNEYVIRCKTEEFGGKDLNRLCKALKAELNISIHSIDPPLNKNPLYCPLTKRRHMLNFEYTESLKTSSMSFEGADMAHSEYIAFHHRYLLGNTKDMNEIVEAFDKVQKYIGEL